MIVSRQNPKLKTIRRLRQSKGDAALLEGPHLVEEAVELGLELDIVLGTPAFLESRAGRRITARLARPPLEVEPALLGELSDVDAPQGILAVAALPRAGVETLPTVSNGLYVFAQAIQDPGNLGALARSSEAAGAAALILSPGTVHANHPRAMRASAGSLLRLPVAADATLDAARARLEDLGARWVALAPGAGSSLYDADLTGPLVLVVGAEGAGLDAAAVETCDAALDIPIEPSVESLNATVAAAVALFEARRQRLAAMA